jgi:hypothetical protein
MFILAALPSESVYPVVGGLGAAVVALYRELKQEKNNVTEALFKSAAAQERQSSTVEKLTASIDAISATNRTLIAINEALRAERRENSG